MRKLNLLCLLIFLQGCEVAAHMETRDAPTRPKIVSNVILDFQRIEPEKDLVFYSFTWNGSRCLTRGFPNSPIICSDRQIGLVQQEESK